MFCLFCLCVLCASLFFSVFGFRFFLAFVHLFVYYSCMHPLLVVFALIEGALLGLLCVCIVSCAFLCLLFFSCILRMGARAYGEEMD